MIIYRSCTLSHQCDSITYLISVGVLCVMTMSVLAISDKYVDGVLMPKCFFTIITGLFLLIVFVICTFKTRSPLNFDLIYKQTCNGVILLGGIEAILALCPECCTLIYRRPGLVGSFDNASGLISCLCLIYPIVLFRVKNDTSIYRIVYIVVATLIILVVALYRSRSGMICVAFLSMLILLKNQKRRFGGIVMCLLLMLPMSILFFKIGSSQGRWFILRRSYEMFQQHMILGWGSRGFQSHYMNTQADYFSHFSASPYKDLADNIHHPLNEWVCIAVNYGIVGIILCLTIAVVICLYYVKHKTCYGREGMVLFLSISFLACFTYVFYYPFTWLVLLLASFLVFNPLLKTIYFKANLGTLLRIGIISICLIFAYLMTTFTIQQIKWKDVSDTARYGLANCCLKEYSLLYATLGHSTVFIYNYAAVLYKAKEYNKSLAIICNVERRYADYDVLILKAECLAKTHRYVEALSAFRRAHDMCPSRFLPLFGQYRVYRECHYTNACTRLRTCILNKRVKVNSREVQYMISYVKNDSL